MRRIFAMATASLLMFAFAAYSAVAAIGRPQAPAASSAREQGSAPVVVRIVSPVVVSDDNVQLGKIGEISATRTKDRDDLLELSVARMPEGKDTITVPARYIESRVREVLGHDRNIEFEIPETVELRRAVRRLSATAFAAEVERKAREEKRVPESAEIQIEPVGFPESIEAPEGAKIEITPASASPGDWHGQVLFRIKVKGEAVEKEILATAKVRWLGKRWTAVRGFGFRAPIRAEDFELVETELNPAKNPPPLAATKDELAALLEGTFASRAIAKGQPLMPSQIGRAPDIQRGQKLKIVLRSESGLSVIAAGHALKNAAVGSELTARLERTGRVVSGKLVEKDRMEIGL